MPVITLLKASWTLWCPLNYWLYKLLYHPQLLVAQTIVNNVISTSRHCSNNRQFSKPELDKDTDCKIFLPVMIHCHHNFCACYVQKTTGHFQKNQIDYNIITTSVCFVFYWNYFMIGHKYVSRYPFYYPARLFLAGFFYCCMFAWHLQYIVWSTDLLLKTRI